MKLWEEVDTFGRSIEHRGLLIRQASHDLLFFGLSGDDMSRLNRFSIESYSIRDDEIITDEILRCICIRRQYGETK